MEKALAITLHAQDGNVGFEQLAKSLWGHGRCNRELFQSFDKYSP